MVFLSVSELNFYPWRHCLSEFKFDLAVPLNICETLSHVVIGNGEKELSSLENELESCDMQLLYQTVCSQSKNACDIFKKCLEISEISARVSSFVDLLSKSVQVRVKKQPGICRNCVKRTDCLHAKTGILFSGGLDSTVIALLTSKYVPLDEPIDLYNVAFENPSKEIVNFDVPDRKTGEMSLEELRSLCPERQWNFVKVIILLDKNP